MQPDNSAIGLWIMIGKWGPRVGLSNRKQSVVVCAAVQPALQSAQSHDFRAPTAGSHSPPNPSSPHLVQLQLWTPQITKTRLLMSVTPVSSTNNRSIPPFNPRGGPSKIPQLTCHPPHSTKSHPPLTTCTQAIPTTHGPLVLKATLLCHIACLSNTRRL